MLQLIPTAFYVLKGSKIFHTCSMLLEYTKYVVLTLSGLTEWRAGVWAAGLRAGSGTSAGIRNYNH